MSESISKPAQVKVRILRIPQAEFEQYCPEKADHRDQRTEWFRDEACKIIGCLEYDRMDGPSSNIGWCCVLWWRAGESFTSGCKDFHGNMSRRDASDLLVRAMAAVHKSILAGEPVEKVMWKKDLNVSDVDMSVVNSPVTETTQKSQQSTQLAPASTSEHKSTKAPHIKPENRVILVWLPVAVAAIAIGMYSQLIWLAASGAVGFLVALLVAENTRVRTQRLSREIQSKFTLNDEQILQQAWDKLMAGDAAAARVILVKSNTPAIQEFARRCENGTLDTGYKVRKDLEHYQRSIGTAPSEGTALASVLQQATQRHPGDSLGITQAESKADEEQKPEKGNKNTPYERGGANEPYCSEDCYAKGGQMAFAVSLGGQQGRTGKCIICGALATTGADLAIPQHGMIALFCRRCVDSKRAQSCIDSMRECAWCGKSL